MDTAFVTYDVKSKSWTLGNDFKFEGYGVEVFIKKGFSTDLASIPRILWRVIAPFELSIEAPLVHDDLYRNGGKHLRGVVDRKEADEIFRTIMICEGVSKWRYTIGYWGVRLFGSSSWKGVK